MPVDRFELPDLGPATTASSEDAVQRLNRCAKAGLLRLAVEPNLGGLGGGFSGLIAAHRHLGRQTRDPGLILALNAHIWGAVFPIVKFASDAQRADWLPNLLDGSLIGGHAITEPSGGSETGAMRSLAVGVDGGYRLDGHKRYITNVPIAEMMVVYARLEDEPGLGAFLVRRDDPGVEFAVGPSVAGCATATMGDLVLSDCRLPLSRLLGRPGAGAQMIQSALELERAFIFAGIAGVMRWQLEHVLRETRQRKSSDGRFVVHQAVTHKLADMKLRLDTAELWIERCAALCDAGRRITLESAQTKLFASEAFLQSSLDAVHILGAFGLESELPGLVTDAMAGRLFSGTSEIQKNIIATILGVGCTGR